jgi:hypothetical protein
LLDENVTGSVVTDDARDTSAAEAICSGVAAAAPDNLDNFLVGISAGRA